MAILLVRNDSRNVTPNEINLIKEEENCESARSRCTVREGDPNGVAGGESVT